MIFISYSSPDRQAAQNLAEVLTKNGILFWVDFREIPIGWRFISEIGAAIENSSTYAILNPSCSLSSYWVAREFDAAVRLRRSNRIRIIAIESTATADLSRTLFDSICKSTTEAVKILESQPRTTEESGCPSKLDNGEIVDFQGENVDFSDTGIWLGYTDSLVAIDNWLFDRSVGLWISGPPGSGKTALVRNWLYAFQRIGYSRIDHAAIEIIDARASTDLYLPSPRLRPQTQPCFLIIDSAETVDKSVLSKAIAEALNTGIRMIIVSRAPCTDLGLQSSFRSIELHALSEKDSSLLAESAGISLEVSKYLYRVTKGQPHIFTTALLQIGKERDS